MKRKYFNGKAGCLATIRIGCTAAICTLPAQLFAGDTEPADSPVAEVSADEVEPSTNWIELSVGGADISGDEGAFRRRLGQDDFWGGISSLHYEQEAGDVIWTLDGHALFGNEDYEIILGGEKLDLGYVELGYREFRTWYDGTGGFMPPNNWFPIYDGHELDRGEVWLEAGLRMEDIPEFTFRYTHGWREGEKDTTMWSSDPSRTFYIVSGMNVIDEERDTFELDVTHTLGNTDLALGLIYEKTSNDNVRAMTGLNNGVTTYQRDVYESDLFNGHLSSETRINDEMLLSFGYSYTTMDIDPSGSTRYQDVGIGRHDFTPIVADGQMSLHVANVNFWWNPVEDLVIVPSFRAEWETQDANALFDEPGEDLFGVHEFYDASYDSLTEQIEARYSGIDNVLLYAKVLFNQVDGDTEYVLTEEEADEEGFRLKSSDTDKQKYLVGANWYALPCLSFSGQYYYQDYEVDYDNVNVGTDPHLGDHEFETNDFSLRMTWRPRSCLTLVSRYDYQNVTIDTQGLVDGDGEDEFVPLAMVESADITRHIFSQSATWTPLHNLYLQGSVSYVNAETDTPVNVYAPSRVTDVENDYLTASATVGYSFDSRTDVTASYSFYYADDYALPSGGVGYGTDLEEHVFSVALNRRVRDNVLWNVRYAYYTSNDGTSGGFNDFDAHMVSTGLRVGF